LTRDLLLRDGFSIGMSSAGDIFVQAAEALGAAVVFRKEDIGAGINAIT
jgi:hypothetical protein